MMGEARGATCPFKKVARLDGFGCKCWGAFGAFDGSGNTCPGRGMLSALVCERHQRLHHRGHKQE